MTGACVPEVRRLSTPGPEDTGIDGRDWDDLLNAVKARLRLTVGICAGATAELRAPDKALWVQAGVLECVAALDQLHASLKHDRSRHRQLELEVFSAPTELAPARPELASSRSRGQRGIHLVWHQGLDG